jgi:hypothetical protein
MRGVVAALCAVLVGGIAALAGLTPAEAKETEEFNIGPWTGFSYTSDSSGQFTDCTVWAFNRNNVQIGVSVDKEWHLELWLNSKAWNLPANQSYPISYWIDRNRQYSGRAETSGDKYVVIEAESDQDVFNELQNGSQVTFRAQNEDYIFNLSQSRAALSRLLNCVDQYTKQASTNPFGAGSSSGDAQQQQQSQQPPQQEQQQSSQGSGPSYRLDTYTETAEDVRQLMIDVTGAKPAMIAAEEKTDKQDFPYYRLKTPIGDGEFWQERLGDRDLETLASRYLDYYKKDCGGDFEPVVDQPVGGSKGRLATGHAACSSSKYQDNGPEVLSYAVVEAGGVVSFYMTYVGGNAAKAKTDNLGKLVARRLEAEIK